MNLVCLYRHVSAPNEEVPIRSIFERHATSARAVLPTALLLLATVAAAADAQAPDSEVVVPTDSLSGELVQFLPDAFLVRTDEGREVLFEIVPDTVETRAEVVDDSLTRPMPHASVMEPRDILFVLEQLEESDERDRVHVHYVTVGETEPRRIAIWLSIEREDVVPGG